MFMAGMREAGFWEGKINLTFENTCLHLKAEDWLFMWIWDHL